MQFLGVVPIVALLCEFVGEMLAWHLLSLNKEPSSAFERRNSSYYFAKGNTLAQISMCCFVLSCTGPGGWCDILFRTRRVNCWMIKNPTK